MNMKCILYDICMCPGLKEISAKADYEMHLNCLDEF